MGCIGMTYDSFCCCTPSQFAKTYQKWMEVQQNSIRMSWEQARQISYSAISPHLKKNIKVRDWMPFSWDDEKKPQQTTTREEDKSEFERIMAQYKIKRDGNDGIDDNTGNRQGIEGA